MIKKCIQCNNEYKTHEKNRKYCSRLCYYASKKGKPTWNKGTTGVMVAWNKGLKGVQVAWNKGTVGLTSGCWKGKEIPEYAKEKMRQAKLKNPTRYWLNKSRPEMCGDNHPNWSGGITPENEKERKHSRYQMWRKSVFERDNYTCRKCGERGGYLHAHHILFFAKYKEHRTEIQNGITFCKECHKSVHKRLRQQEKILQEINT